MKSPVILLNPTEIISDEKIREEPETPAKVKEEHSTQQSIVGNKRKRIVKLDCEKNLRRMQANQKFKIMFATKKVGP